jgi:hypothetical protein
MLYNVDNAGLDSIGLAIVIEELTIAFDISTLILGHFIKSAECREITGASVIEFQSGTIAKNRRSQTD